MFVLDSFLSTVKPCRRLGLIKRILSRQESNSVQTIAKLRIALNYYFSYPKYFNQRRSIDGSEAMILVCTQIICKQGGCSRWRLKKSNRATSGFVQAHNGEELLPRFNDSKRHPDSSEGHRLRMSNRKAISRKEIDSRWFFCGGRAGGRTRKRANIKGTATRPLTSLTNTPVGSFSTSLYFFLSSTLFLSPCISLTALSLSLARARALVFSYILLHLL